MAHLETITEFIEVQMPNQEFHCSSIFNGLTVLTCSTPKALTMLGISAIL